jgi:hypothetical protein
MVERLFTGVILGAGLVLLRILAVSDFDQDSAMAILSVFNPTDVLRIILAMAIAQWPIVVIGSAIVGVVSLAVTISSRPNLVAVFVTGTLLAVALSQGSDWLDALTIGLSVALLTLMILLDLVLWPLSKGFRWLMAIVLLALLWGAIFGDFTGIPAWALVLLVCLSIASAIYLPGPVIPPSLLLFSWVTEEEWWLHRAFRGLFTFLTFVVLGAVFLFGFFGKVPWVAPESLASPTYTGVGYVLGSNQGWLTVLDDKSRRVVLVKEEEIRTRQQCEPSRSSVVIVPLLSLKEWYHFEVLSHNASLPIVSVDTDASLTLPSPMKRTLLANNPPCNRSSPPSRLLGEPVDRPGG